MMIKKKKRISIVMLTGFLIGTMAFDAYGGTATAPAGTLLDFTLAASFTP